MTDKEKRLLLFTRYPNPGTTKTRLIARLGEQRAAELQKLLTEHIFHQAFVLKDTKGIPLDVCYSGGDLQQFLAWLGKGVRYRQQGEGDIGKRMHEAFLRSFAEGDEKVVLIGSDVPAITAEILLAAFVFLENNDVVIGPAKDGGYYLIGLNSQRGVELSDNIFSGIPWSTETVYRDTISRLKLHQASIAVLPMLQDIDRPEDLEEAHRWITL